MRLIITRPEPVANLSQLKLKLLGYNSIVWPLTRFESLDVNAGFDSISDCGALIFTSQNAARYATKIIQENNLFDTLCFAVGSKTGEILSEIGMTNIQIGPGTGNGLAMFIFEYYAVRSETHSLTYFTGKVRQPDFENTLADLNIALKVFELYDTKEISYSTDYLNKHVLSAERLSFLLYSPKAAIFLMNYSRWISTSKCMENLEFYCLSEAVAKNLNIEFHSKVKVSNEPTEKSLFELLA